MPIIKCSNGKYRIGSGACIYDSEDKAKRVWEAILAHGEYAMDRNKVSYDWDDTLSNNSKVQSKCRADIGAGKQVYIITRRHHSIDSDIFRFAQQVGIPESRIMFTNGAYKYQMIKALGIGVHYDNNEREVNLINMYTDCHAYLV